MAPTSRIFLTRHAQAESNVDLDYSIRDAPLTPLGKKQAASLPLQIPEQLMQDIDLVVSSPLKRTLQTTRIAWAPAIQRLGGLSKIVCLPQAQECNGWPCDTGSSKEDLLADPEYAEYDLSSLTPEWNSKQGFYAIDKFTLDKRACWVRQFLRHRPEKNIVLVAHGDFLRTISRTADEFFVDYPWKNAECKMFTFDPEWVGSEECYLHEEGTVTAAGGCAPTSTEANLL